MIYSYSSEQPGSPVLSGTPGTLASLLRAVLVDGFGAAAPSSVTVSAGVVTANYANAFGFRVGSPLLMAGASQASLNTVHRVTAVAGNAVSFDAPAGVSGTVTGTITTKVPPAGWAMPFNDTGIACFAPNAPEATGCVLRVDDSGSTIARVRGFESMSGASAGLGPIPTDVLLQGGGYWMKSAVASAAVFWALFADERTFLFFVRPVSTSAGFTCYYAGDIDSLRSGDSWAWLLTCDTGDRTSLATVPEGCCGYAGRSVRAGAYVARETDGIPGARQVQRVGLAQNGSATDAWSGSPNYSPAGLGPNATGSALLLTPVEIHGDSARGTLRGLFHARNDWRGTYQSGEILQGGGALQGRLLQAMRVGPPWGQGSGTVFVDTTGPWGA